MKHYLSHNAFIQPSSRIQYCSQTRRVAPAFTRVEMLVVISIITVLLTVGAMGLKNMGKASGVGAGIPIAEAIFAEARALAIGKGTRARVLIHATENHADEYHRERYLRYMAIQYFKPTDPDDPSAGGNWVLASKGVSLPKAVYFMKTLSEKGGVTLPMESGVILPGKSSTNCYYYEFNAEGMIVPAPSGNNVPRFVIASASLPPGQPEPIISGKNIGGFVIWRTGRTSLFRHPDQIDPSL